MPFALPSAGLVALLLLAAQSSVSAQTQGSRYINPPSLTKPNGYTHVVVAPDNRTVYVAGQVAFDSTGQLVGAGDFKAQAQRVREPASGVDQRRRVAGRRG